MTYEWRIVVPQKRPGGWGRITLHDEASARAYLESEHPGAVIELRPYVSRGRRGRPAGWRALESRPANVATRLTEEEAAWLAEQPGATTSDKLRGVIARAMR